MSTSSDSLAEGFAALLSISGEALTFRGAALEAVVNRAVRGDHLPQNPDFSPQEASEIEIAAGALATLPKAGEIFTDSAGLFHRVSLVQNTGPAVRCLCKVTR